MCHSNCQVSKINFNDIIGSSNSAQLDVLHLKLCSLQPYEWNYKRHSISQPFSQLSQVLHSALLVQNQIKSDLGALFNDFDRKKNIFGKEWRDRNQKICIACIDGSVDAKASNFIRFAHFLRENLVIFSRLQWRCCIWLVELFSSAICTLESAVELEIRNFTSSARSRSI